MQNFKGRLFKKMLSDKQSEFALQTFLGSFFLCEVTDVDLAYFESVLFVFQNIALSVRTPIL